MRNTVEFRQKRYEALRNDGLSVQDAAEQLGVTRQACSRYERKYKDFLKRIAATERYYDERLAAGAGTDELVKVVDMLNKLRSTYYKY
ncbi:helix-turn-helix transcriptional regulator [Bacteroides sp.]|uniref:helix-turn-helix domain-containing protein n=1 Tax=Bacteroides sp. TaxID=29523 RepID=UPI0025BC291A|nr:helix-turn-helix transcriptional regulator [Bacteroides sp.]